MANDYITAMSSFNNAESAARVAAALATVAAVKLADSAPESLPSPTDCLKRKKTWALLAEISRGAGLAWAYSVVLPMIVPTTEYIAVADNMVAASTGSEAIGSTAETGLQDVLVPLISGRWDDIAAETELRGAR